MSEHRVTEARPSDPFDRLLADLMGLPNGAHTAPAPVQIVDFYGNSTTYVVQTLRTEEGGATVFITTVTGPGAQRLILPQKVLTVIDRQRESITTQLRRRHGRRIAEERKAAGIEPGFMKAKKGGKRKRK